MSKFLMHLFAALAEMERGMIRERVCAGFAQQRHGEPPLDALDAFSGGMRQSDCETRG